MHGDVEDYVVDKFELSKLIDKYLRIGYFTNDETELKKIEVNIFKIFDNRVIIENYRLWEKVLEFFIINNKMESVLTFISKIIKAIENIEYKLKNISIQSLQETLIKFLDSAFSRPLALNWNKEHEVIISQILKKINYKLEIPIFRQKCNQYCETRMVDKNVIPFLIDIFFKDKQFDLHENLNLTNYLEIIQHLSNKTTLPNPSYMYYPYMVTISDLSTYFMIKKLIENNESELDLIEGFEEQQRKYYFRLNFNKLPPKSEKYVDVSTLNPTFLKNISGSPSSL